MSYEDHNYRCIRDNMIFAAVIAAAYGIYRLLLLVLEYFSK